MPLWVPMVVVMKVTHSLKIQSSMLYAYPSKKSKNSPSSGYTVEFNFGQFGRACYACYTPAENFISAPEYFFRQKCRMPVVTQILYISWKTITSIIEYLTIWRITEKCFKQENRCESQKRRAASLTLSAALTTFIGFTLESIFENFYIHINLIKVLTVFFFFEIFKLFRKFQLLKWFRHCICAR